MNSAVQVVTALQPSVRLTLVIRAAPAEDAVWNATEPPVNRAVPQETVRCSVRARPRHASKVVQLTEAGAP